MQSKCTHNQSHDSLLSNRRLSMCSCVAVRVSLDTHERILIHRDNYINVHVSGALCLPGAVYFSQTVHSVVIPESIPVGTAVLRLYVLESPTPDLTSSVACRIRGMTVGNHAGSSDGEFNKDDCPFETRNASLWLHVKLPLHESLEMTGCYYICYLVNQSVYTV